MLILGELSPTGCANYSIIGFSSKKYLYRIQEKLIYLFHYIKANYEAFNRSPCAGLIAST